MTWTQLLWLVGIVLVVFCARRIEVRLQKIARAAGAVSKRPTQ